MKQSHLLPNFYAAILNGFSGFSAKDIIKNGINELLKQAFSGADDINADYLRLILLMQLQTLVGITLVCVASVKTLENRSAVKMRKAYCRFLTVIAQFYPVKTPCSSIAFKGCA